MPFTLNISEAAHKYGMDNYSSATNAGDAARYGVVTGQSDSLGDNVRIGQTAGVSVFYSNGFRVNADFRVTSTSSATITAMSVIKTETGETLHHFAGSLAVSTFSLQPTDRSLFSGADTINGNSYNNILQGWGGNDSINGGAGTDTVVLSGLRSQYTVSRSGGTITTSGTDGTDTLTGIERLQFNNQTVAYDTDGVGGQAYRLYQAAFNRAPDLAGLGFHIKAMDGGQSLKATAQGFLNSAEFSRTYGSLDNTAFITKLYGNVLHRAPDAAGMQYQSAALNSGSVDRAQLLANFSESPENQAALIGTIQGGMVYTV